MNSNYTTVISYENDPNYEARTETIVGRGYRDTRTVYVPVGTPEYKIPARDLHFDPAEVAAVWESVNWIMARFGK